MSRGRARQDGVAPNRIFNLEWRTTPFVGGSANYEVRLYENAPDARWDLLCGAVTFSDSANLGVQRSNGSRYTQLQCNLHGLPSGLQVAPVPEQAHRLCRADPGSWANNGTRWLCSWPLTLITAPPLPARGPGA